MTALTYNPRNPSEWVVRRCINSFRNEYEFWPGYCEQLLTLEELIDALVECSRLWPNHTFSGHKVDVTRQLKMGRRWSGKRHGYAKSALNGRRARRQMSLPSSGKRLPAQPKMPRWR